MFVVQIGENKVIIRFGDFPYEMGDLWQCHVTEVGLVERHQMRLLIDDQISQWWGLSIGRHFLLVWSLQERLFEHYCTWLSPALQASAGRIYPNRRRDDNAK